MPRSDRRSCLTVLGIIALAGGLFIAREVYVAVTMTPGDPIDYAGELTRLAQESQPEGRNGWGDLESAIDAMNETEQDLDPYVVSEVLFTVRDPREHAEYGGSMTGDEVHAAAEEIISHMEQRGAWASLDRLASSPSAVRNITDPNVTALIESIVAEQSQARQLARLLAMRMHVAHRAGRDVEAAQAFAHGLAVARALGSQPVLIDYLVAGAIANLMLGELHYELIERPHDETALLSMLDAIDRLRLPGIAVAFRGERLEAMRAIQASHTDDGTGDGRLILSGASDISAFSGGVAAYSEWKIANLASRFYPTKRETTALADRYFDALIACSQLTFAERQRTPPPALLAPAAIPPRQALLGLMLSTLKGSMDSADLDSMHRGGARVAIAIELYNIEHGSYPASLEELVPSILSELPVDPFASSGRFGYALVPNDPSGRRYVLYSTGEDGTDNGGNVNPGEPMAPAHQGPGFDLILNMPRPEAEQGGG